MLAQASLRKVPKRQEFKFKHLLFLIHLASFHPSLWHKLLCIFIICLASTQHSREHWYNCTRANFQFLIYLHIILKNHISLISRGQKSHSLLYNSMKVILAVNLRNLKLFSTLYCFIIQLLGILLQQIHVCDLLRSIIDGMNYHFWKNRASLSSHIEEVIDYFVIIESLSRHQSLLL